MSKRYRGFSDLPEDVTERLKKRITAGADESEPTLDVSYTGEELSYIVDAFTKFNNAVQRGLPNQFYDMLCRTLDMGIAQRAYAKYLIWFSHEGTKYAEEIAQRFANDVKTEIKKRKNWNEGKIHDEYFLR